MAATHSVYNIKIEDQIVVKTGITTGYVLSANSDGTTTYVNVPLVRALTSAATTVLFSNVPDDTGFVPYGWITIDVNGITLLVPAWN